MEHRFATCSECGAPVEQSADATRIECRYCGRTAALALDPAVVVRSLGARLADPTNGFAHLAELLAEALPAHVEVRRKSALFGKGAIESITLVLGKRTFRAVASEHAVVAERLTVVRGITVKTEELALDHWLHAVCVALSEHAGANATADAALRRITRV